MLKNSPPLSSHVPSRRSRLGAALPALWLVAAATTLALACGSSSDGGNTDCAAPVPTYAQLKTGALTKCTNCHSSMLTTAAQRTAAPTNVNYDTYAAAKDQAEDGAHQVKIGQMPFAGSPALTEQEKADFLKWAACGTPQ
jgi:uncharacterized membrane protein